MSGNPLTGLVETGTPAIADGTPVAATFSADGSLRVTTGSGGTVVVTGSSTPSDVTANPTNCINIESFGMIYRQGGGFWERMGSQYMRSSAAENVGVVSQGGVLTSACLRGVDFGSNQYVYIATNASDQALAVGGIFNSAAPAPSNGDRRSFQLDAGANLFTQVGRPQVGTRSSPSYYNEWGGVGVDHALIKNSAGMVLGIDVSNDDAVAYWFMLFNLSAAPSNGDFPIFRRKLLANTAPPGNLAQVGREFFAESGTSFSNGIGWAISTTGTNLTLPGGTPNVAVQVSYV